MAPLVRRTSSPEPLTEDPFRGGDTVTAIPEEFDGRRFAAAGATEQELVTLAEHYDTMDRAERRRLLGWLDRSTDAEVAQWVEQWRAFVADEEARLALIDGTVEEVLDRVRAAPDEARLDLARRTLAAEETQGEDDIRSTLTEPLEQLIAELEEAAGADETRAAELSALTEGSVAEVLARVGDDAELARRTLDAERELRGDDARKTLVESLDKLAAESPAEGSEGAGTPTTTPDAGSEPLADGAGSSDAAT